MVPARSKSADPAAASESVRDRILNTARELFYREGARAVGVDTVVAQSGVAKTSLYRWFPSKDALIVAVLEEEAKDRWAGWDYNAQRADPAPREQLRAHLAGITRYVSSSKYRGCPFANVITDFPDPTHPSRAVCRAVDEELRRRLFALVSKLDVENPDELTDQFVLLINGAFATAMCHDKNGPQKYLVPIAETLIDSQSKKS
jgi:AcrR family transcriptional regulator